MNNLQLPAIEPARPVAGAADAIDRAGAKVGRAFDNAGAMAFEAQQAQTAVQTQESALQVTKGIDEVRQVIRDNPYVSPEWVKNAFGGKVPEGVRLTQKYGEEEVGRTAIPMHEIAPLLLDQHTKRTLDAAVTNIESAGHRQSFQLAAEKDIEQARKEVFDWRNAQMLADAHIKTVSQLQQAAAARNWPLYEAILNTPQNQLEVKAREELRANLPRLKTHAVIEDRLRSRRIEDLQNLITDINSNRVIDPTKKPIIENADGTFSTEKTITVEMDGKHVVMPTIVNGVDVGEDRAIELYRQGKNEGVAFDSAAAADKYAQNRHLNEERNRESDRGAFHAQLSAEEQLLFTTKAHARIREVEHEEDRLEKKASERRFEGYADTLQAAIQQSRATGAPLSSIPGGSVNDIPITLKGHEFQWALAMIDRESKEVKRETDNRVWMQLSEKDKNGQLATMPKAELWSYMPGLSDADQRHWMDRWAKAQNGQNDPSKSMFSAREYDAMDRILASPPYKLKKPKEGEPDKDGFYAARVQLERNMMAYREKHPDEPMLDDAIANIARMSTFTSNPESSLLGLISGTAGSEIKKHLTGPDVKGAYMTLNWGIRAANPGQMVSDQDVLDHLKQMTDERPLVAEAWKVYNSSTPLDDTARAVVHTTLVNPVNLKQIDAQLTAEGKEINERNRVYRIVKDMQLPQSRPAAAKAEEEARLAAERKQVQKVGAELKAQADAEKTMSDAERKVMEDEFKRLPYWEQRAELDARKAWSNQETTYRGHIAQRIYAEDLANQRAQAAAAGRKYIVGNRSADDPVRIQIEKRIDAEAAVGREQRRFLFDSEERTARNAYRLYWERNMLDSDGSTKLFAPPGFIDNMHDYIQLRREGKVQ